MIIKILLILGLITAAVLAYRSPLNSRNAALRRLFGIVLLLLAVTAVVFPDTVTAVAARIGVGRGTDLVLYVLAVVTVLAFLGLYRRLHELEQRLTLLTRRTALFEAQAHVQAQAQVPAAAPDAGPDAGADPPRVPGD